MIIVSKSKVSQKLFSRKWIILTRLWLILREVASKKRSIASSFNHDMLQRSNDALIFLNRSRKQSERRLWLSKTLPYQRIFNVLSLQTNLALYRHYSCFKLCNVNEYFKWQGSEVLLSSRETCNTKLWRTLLEVDSLILSAFRENLERNPPIQLENPLSLSMRCLGPFEVSWGTDTSLWSSPGTCNTSVKMTSPW